MNMIYLFIYVGLPYFCQQYLIVFFFNVNSLLLKVLHISFLVLLFSMDNFLYFVKNIHKFYVYAYIINYCYFKFNFKSLLLVYINKTDFVH